MQSSRIVRVARLLLLLCAAAPATARSQGTATDGATLVRRARAEENAAHYDRAGQLYKQAALAFERVGQSTAQVDALQRSAAAYERSADALIASAPAAPKRAAAVSAVPAGAAVQPAHAPDQAAAPRAGIELGMYLCHEWAGGGMAVVRRVEIKNDRDYMYYSYNDREKVPGQYRFDARTGAVTWLSGRLRGFTGAEYKFEREHSRMRLTFGDPGFHQCFRSE